MRRNRAEKKSRVEVGRAGLRGNRDEGMRAGLRRKGRTEMKSRAEGREQAA